MNIRAKFLLLAAALTLAGCSTSGSGDVAGRLLVSPDKFQNHNCDQLAIRAVGIVARRKQVEQLMAKAGTSLDGRLVSLLAYQTEYTELGGDLNELRRTAAAKNCKPIPALQTPAR